MATVLTYETEFCRFVRWYLSAAFFRQADPPLQLSVRVPRSQTLVEGEICAVAGACWKVPHWSAFKVRRVTLREVDFLTRAIREWGYGPIKDNFSGAAQLWLSAPRLRRTQWGCGSAAGHCRIATIRISAVRCSRYLPVLTR